jgi:hypothetical protein
MIDQANVDSSGIQHGTQPSVHRSVRLMLVVVLVVILTCAGGLYLYLGQSHSTGPAGFNLTSHPERVPPGSTACAPTNGEVCYATGIMVTQGGATLSDLSFKVIQGSGGVVGGTPVPLGPSAAVRMLNGQGEVVGDWNWTEGTWTSGGQWAIPQSQNVDLVLDTGLTNDTTLASAYFWVTLSGVNGGSAGGSLD